jgi:hypothetical protein
MASASLAWAQSVEEYRVKAAFVYNFAKFVEWPASSFKNAADPITICVFGNPFGDRLTETVSGKQIEDHRLLVREVADLAEDEGCHILFIAGDKKRTAEVLAHLKTRQILTIGESPNFAAAGGVIGFKLESGKVRLQINVRSADRAHLRISSKLLSLAELVKEEK